MRERSKRSVGELTFYLAVGVEMVYIDALPTEPLSEEQTCDDFPEGHKQPSRLHLRYIVSAYPAGDGLTIVDIDYQIMHVELQRPIRTIELRLESSSYLCFSPVGSAITRFVDCIIAEEGHNAIEVVDVEGIRKLRDRILDPSGCHESS